MNSMFISLIRYKMVCDSIRFFIYNGFINFKRKLPHFLTLMLTVFILEHSSPPAIDLQYSTAKKEFFKSKDNIFESKGINVLFFFKYYLKTVKLS